jgi:hypothetical protein
MMTEQHKDGDFSAPQHDETNILVLIKRMQQQLTFLEKKIDTLINQSQQKPFREKSFQEKTYSKPFRSFDRPYRPDSYHGKRSHGEDSQERSFHSGHHHSEKRHGDEHRGFGDKKRGFDPKKKFSFHKRKDH